MTIEANSLSINSSVRQRGWHSVQKQTREVASMTFDDVLDAINPLNHIPFVSRLNENPVSPVIRMLGGTVIGGPLGFAASAIDAIFEEANGKGMLGSVVHAALGEEDPAAIARETASKRYRSLADAHKRHINTWRV